MIAQIPGNTENEVKKYLSNILKISKNNKLIKKEFIHENTWLTFNFLEQYDCDICIKKIQEKEDQFRILRLSPDDTNEDIKLLQTSSNPQQPKTQKEILITGNHI